MDAATSEKSIRKKSTMEEKPGPALEQYYCEFDISDPNTVHVHTLQGQTVTTVKVDEVIVCNEEEIADKDSPCSVFQQDS